MMPTLFMRTVVARVVFGAWCVLLAASAQAQSVQWNGWSFDHEVNANYEGLALRNIKFQNRTLIGKISLPVMRVFYANNACGPYADRLGGTLSPIPWANNATLAKREFTLNGRQWYEIGIRDRIGSYDIYQVYYLSADGILDAHIYSKGLQCVVDHVHYPNWRIDFDLDGTSNDVIERKLSGNFVAEANEFNLPATSAEAHAWRVRDTVTGMSADVLPGFADFSIPNSTTVPVSAYDQNTVFGRAYRSTEDNGWTVGPNVQVPYGNAESLAADPVLWYEGFLPHSAGEGAELWHSTGLRIVSSLVGSPPPPPPPPPPPGGQTATISNAAAITIPSLGKSAPYPSLINVSGMTGRISKVSVKLKGLRHTYPDDLDLLLVGPGGQKVLLMSDAGGSSDVNGITLELDDSASAALPNSSALTSRSVRPTNYGSGDSFSDPAAGAPFASALSAFNGADPNGIWRLFVIDDAASDSGALQSGWEITLTTQ